MKTIQLGSKKFVLMMAALFVVLLVGCSSSDEDGGSSGVVVEAPGVPTEFNVEATTGAILSATLTWTAPTVGGEPSSYEIYRSTTAGTVFNPDNHLVSILVVDKEQTNYQFIDNAGLNRNEPTYWVVAAKNTGGETATTETEYTPSGGAGGELEGFGNNFASAMIFADGYGISGLLLGGTWTENNLSAIDYNTGVRPSNTQTLTEFPYFDEDTTFVRDGVTYYKQQTLSTWQGEWKNGADTPQHVTATWGDNLISQSLTVNSVIRVEMVLSEALSTPMTSYKMVSLYGTKYNEIYGTDKTTYENNSSFVFATNAHLKIQKVDGSGTPLEDPLYDQGLWEGDGPGYFAAEVNVAGNFTYGFVWLFNEAVLPYAKEGIWRITFSLDNTSPKGTSNNTFMDAAANGVLDSSTSAHIDINIGQ